MRYILLILVLFIGCKKPEVTVPVTTQAVEKKRLVGRIAESPRYFRADGSPEKLFITLSDYPEDMPKHRFMWMKIGKKIILPKWFVLGKAQALRTGELEKAWEDGMPGVYKMDYAGVETLFKGMQIEVD